MSIFSFFAWNFHSKAKKKKKKSGQFGQNARVLLTTRSSTFWNFICANRIKTFSDETFERSEKKKGPKMHLKIHTRDTHVYAFKHTREYFLCFILQALSIKTVFLFREYHVSGPQQNRNWIKLRCVTSSRIQISKKKSF